MSKWARVVGKAPANKFNSNVINSMGGWPNKEQRDLAEADKTITCRLEQAKYRKRAAAIARCMEIHGHTFDGYIQSGRFWVFWEWAWRA